MLGEEDNNPLGINESEFDFSIPLDRLIGRIQKKIGWIYKKSKEKEVKDMALLLLRNQKHLGKYYNPMIDDDVDFIKYLLQAIKYFQFMPQDEEIIRIANVLSHSIAMSLHMASQRRK